MNKNILKKATITVMDGEDKNKVISLLFNPTEYSLDRSNSYKATPIPGISSPVLQFVNGESDQLSMDLFMDDYTDPNGPTSLLQKENDPLGERLAAISKLLLIDRELHAPPPVRFNWGTMEFHAIIEKLGRKVTMFHPDGIPARVTLSIVFREYRTLKQQQEDPRLESSDKTKRRIVVGKEQLWFIAAREYGESELWTRIADRNDLDDPREIKPGDWLEIPPLENASGTFPTR
ncbi:CIS tube protein [Gimesia aquarii]|uniref:LysM domain-containing protein n=1 Tax=Gimesia aquarii TaxID=2527964 RepID=A0A517VZX4_9PLAN|nr:LysM peptidoglycan-binding domain-containing protein [Gimesia aquarii]QDT98548.1 hypothetical protein V144x_40550 [Gimesia aquarii]